MIDFEATRPHDVCTDSRPRGWDGFRVVRRVAQAPAELVFDPAVPSASAGAAPVCHDYLVCLNHGLAGRTGFEVDGRWNTLDAAPRHWMIHPGGAAGRYVWSQPADAVHLLLAQRWVDRVAEDLSGNRRRHLLLPPHCSVHVPGYFIALQRLAVLADDSPVQDTLQAELLCHAFVAHLLDRTTDVTLGQRRRIERLALSSLGRVLALIDSALDAPLTLDILAAPTGMSSFHFARAFRHTTGVSPHQYVLRRRLERAHAMLSCTRREVTDVAMACGFATPSHLAAAFRRRYGVSPGALRAR